MPALSKSSVDPGGRYRKLQVQGAIWQSRCFASFLFPRFLQVTWQAHSAELQRLLPIPPFFTGNLASP